MDLLMQGHLPTVHTTATYTVKQCTTRNSSWESSIHICDC